MKTLQEALIAIQAEVKVLKSQKNNFGNYTYRSVEQILAEVKPLLSKYQCIITLNDSIVNVGDRFYIQATATIAKGEAQISTNAFAREALDKKGMDSAQLTGSCSSYARKYALCGLLLLDDNKDIDSLDNQNSQSINSHIQAKQDLATLKRIISAELRQMGLQDSDMRELFSYAKIDTNNAQELQQALEMGLSNIVAEFRGQ